MLVALLVLVIIGGLVAEMLARSLVPNIAESAVRRELGLPKEHTVSLETEGLLSWQVVTGGLNGVTLKVPDAPLNESLTGDLTLTADRIPLDPRRGEMTNPKLLVGLPTDALARVLVSNANGAIDAATVAGENVELTRNLTVFGQTVPVNIDAQVSAQDGNLVFTPQTVRIAGRELDLSAASAQLRGVYDPADPQTFCVKDRLPQGLTITEIDPGEKSTTVQFDMSATFLSDSAQRELGSCS